MKKIVFLTGATGFIGGNIVLRLLNDESISEIYLLIRAQSHCDAEERLKTHLEKLSSDPVSPLSYEKIRVVRGDVTQAGLGIGEILYRNIAEKVTHIIHSAANVSFMQSLEDALKSNYRGTENMLRFALDCKYQGNLEKFGYIGTAYVSGNRGGTIYENELIRPDSFSNTYEQSKYESECLVRSYADKLPVLIFRPSIVIGDSELGVTTAFNVVYYPLKLIYKGRLRIIPGSPKTYIDIVPVDYVANAISYLLFKDHQSQGSTYHLTGSVRSAITAGELVTLALHYFKKVEPKKLFPSVFFVPQVIYATVKRLSIGMLKTVVEKFDVYLPYLSIQRVFDDSNTQNALNGSGIRVPKYSEYYETILRFCLDTEWGKKMKIAA
jgi:long-chain acyl-CoA synthetase